jgi:5-(carboxyamino)imidazole ribonucleotide synthase
MTTIGILGAGQLGKMLAESALKLGYTPHLFAPDTDPLIPEGALHTKADYTDIEALRTFADLVDVITLEFENVPVAYLKEITTPIYPSPSVLEISQHRMKEKTLARDLGIGTAPFAHVTNKTELDAAIKTIGIPGILKTCTLGYDGKGQWKITSASDLPAIDFSTPQDLIYEGFVRFEKEISVIVARSVSGEVQCFEAVENIHKNHILHTTTAPAAIDPSIANKAIEIAEKLANLLNVVGLLSVEMFVVAGNVLVNEMAPRPHNSGHWTMDGCNVSQFEQAIRAVTGMPLIAPKRTASKVVMTNLIGDDVKHLEDWKKQNAHIHIYGKKEIRPGRKMGHVSALTSVE